MNRAQRSESSQENRRKEKKEKNAVRNQTKLDKVKEELLESIGPGKVVIIVGETGSGKSTEIPQMLLRHNPKETIIVTQPRRVAAISLARRVSYLTKDLGEDLVGHTVRFEDTTKRTTRLKYATDGILLKLLENNKRPETVIIDEVHERSIRTDILIGLLKQNITTVKLVFMSATADTKRLTEYFTKDNIPVRLIKIPRQEHKVSIRYLPKKGSDYIQLAFDTIRKIQKESKQLQFSHKHKSERETNTSTQITSKTKRPNRQTEPTDKEIEALEKILIRTRPEENTETKETLIDPEKNNNLSKSINEDISFSKGTILVFLSGIEDINDLYSMLEILPGIEVLKLHSTLSDTDQKKIFQRREKDLRIILSTNIAETSLTIPDVKWVIDTGVQKMNIVREGIESLGIVKITKSSAKQRAGRAGRVSAGICYRLYTEETYNQLEENNLPEILRSDLSSVSLSLISLGIDPLSFDFFEAPEKEHLVYALKELFVLGLITKETTITPLGESVNKLPISPSMGKFILVAKSLNVICSACAICAVLSSEKLSFFSKETDLSKIQSTTDKDYSSDLTMYASIFFTFLSYTQRLRKEYCQQLNVSYRDLVMAEKIYNQLLVLLNHKEPNRKELSFFSSNPSSETEVEQKETNGQISLLPFAARNLHKAATSAFLTRIAEASTGPAYTHLYSNTSVFIHPSSLFFKRKEPHIGFILTTQTTKPYILYVFPYTN
ncbi:hypothetical protein NEOKW01_0340 [Nematocida sp. AWRm80]|nr:hypothetical protein NEOKW01_0340 [Nematocida sp. AWRm80]